MKKDHKKLSTHIKANITYNLDNAPADKLEEAKRDAYFEGRRIEPCVKVRWPSAII